MTKKIFIVKSGGKRPSEEFQPEKLHNSIVATCLSLHTPEGQAEETANMVCLEVIRWCGDRTEITSADIRRIASEVLAKHHLEASYLYKQQLTVL